VTLTVRSGAGASWLIVAGPQALTTTASTAKTAKIKVFLFMVKLLILRADAPLCPKDDEPQQKFPARA
jgi:hypothetical protein